MEKEALEKQVASSDSTIEELEKAKKALIDDIVGTFEEGFKEALAQAVYENPGINVSNCDSTHHVVDGRVVPLELDDSNADSQLPPLLFALYIRSCQSPINL